MDAYIKLSFMYCSVAVRAGYSFPRTPLLLFDFTLLLFINKVLFFHAFFFCVLRIKHKKITSNQAMACCSTVRREPSKGFHPLCVRCRVSTPALNATPTLTGSPGRVRRRYLTFAQKRKNVSMCVSELNHRDGEIAEPRVSAPRLHVCRHRRFSRRPQPRVTACGCFPSKQGSDHTRSLSHFIPPALATICLHRGSLQIIHSRSTGSHVCPIFLFS